MNFRGATLDQQHDQVIEAMAFTAGGAGAPGGLFHWVTETDDDIRVIDVWDSKEQDERFAQEQIGPLSQQAGFAAPPEVTSHDTQNYLTADNEPPALLELASPPAANARCQRRSGLPKIRAPQPDTEGLEVP